MVKCSTYGSGRGKLVKALSEREPFQTGGALRGDIMDANMMTRYDLGDLSNEQANRFMVDFLAGIAYVVWSYQTPIAWVREDGIVHHVEQWFSHTTSKHQGVTRAYL